MERHLFLNCQDWFLGVWLLPSWGSDWVEWRRAKLYHLLLFAQQQPSWSWESSLFHWWERGKLHWNSSQIKGFHSSTEILLCRGGIFWFQCSFLQQTKNSQQFSEFGPGWIQLEEGLQGLQGQRRVAAEAKGLQWWSIQYRYDPFDQYSCFGD